MSELSGWPSGLRRQTQGLEHLTSLSGNEVSGPRMWAWVRIPLLTNIFSFACTFCHQHLLSLKDYLRRYIFFDDDYDAYVCVHVYTNHLKCLMRLQRRDN